MLKCWFVFFVLCALSRVLVQERRCCLWGVTSAVTLHLPAVLLQKYLLLNCFPPDQKIGASKYLGGF